MIPIKSKRFPTSQVQTANTRQATVKAPLWALLGFGMSILALVVAQAILTASPATASTATEVFYGRAVDADGQVAYTEEHQIHRRNGTVIRSRTVYRDADDRVIGELVSNYTHGPQYGSYAFKDLRARYEDGVSVTDSAVELYRMEKGATERDTASLARRNDQIVGQGFNQFIATHLDAIAQGKAFPLKLVMPSRMSQYDFRVRKLAADKQRVLVRLEINNWFLRMVAPHVEAEYDRQTGRLLQYEGVSNIADADGNYNNVSISYRYPIAGDRP